jgi:hypothetical protein
MEVVAHRRAQRAVNVNDMNFLAEHFAEREHVYRCGNIWATSHVLRKYAATPE